MIEEDQLVFQKLVLEEFVGGSFKPWFNTKNRYFYTLHEGKVKSVHRLIASLTLTADKTKPDINHIDSRRWNNSPTNLERCTRAYNVKYAFDNNDRKPTWEGVIGKDNPKSKAVVAVHRDTGETLHYDSLHDAERAGWCISLVCRAAKKQRTHHKGYIWDYVDQQPKGSD